MGGESRGLVPVQRGIRADAAVSRVAAACNAIMAGASAAGVVLMAGGAVAAHAGSRAGALVCLNAWLLWPLGALTCGVAVLVLWRKE